MSTKLYDGLQLADPTLPLFDVAATVAKAVRPVFDAKAREIVADQAVHVMDSPALREEYADTSLFNAAWRNWTKAQDTYGRSSALEDPLRLSIVFGKAPSGRVLAYPFQFSDTYTSALEATGLFVDCHFQDQTDQPDDVDDAEWALRAADWDAVLDGDGTLSSLPMWQLPGSRTGVFSHADRIDVDANAIRTPDERLEDILTDLVAAELTGDVQWSWTYAKAAERTSRVFLRSEDGRKVPRPAAVPDLRTWVADLPPMPWIPDDVVGAVTRRARKLTAHG